MKKKSRTQVVLKTDRASAKKSTRRRAAGGGLNALTHGFFAKELALNDEEKQELETIRRTMHPQLSPETVLQNLAFAQVLACIGRCKLALRMEMRRVSRMLDDGSAQQAQGNHAEGPAAQTEWYLSGKQELREGIRRLEALKEDFLNLGRIDEKWNVVLDRAFGPQLRELLTHWMPSDPTAVMLAHHLTMHARTFGGPLPCLEQEHGSSPDGGDTPKVILDPDQSKQMVIKLLEQEVCILSDLWKSSEQRASDSERAQNQAVDFAPRYFTTASRDLHRAVAWYMHLKKEKL
jgi:hypothetical protein